jgi:hypothetical protein
MEPGTRNQEPRLRGVATVWKREENQWELQEEHRAGDCEARSRDFQRVAENQEFDLVERSTTPKRKRNFLAGLVEEQPERLAHRQFGIIFPHR